MRHHSRVLCCVYCTHIVQIPWPYVAPTLSWGPGREWRRGVDVPGYIPRPTKTVGFPPPSTASPCCPYLYSNPARKHSLTLPPPALHPRPPDVPRSFVCRRSARPAPLVDAKTETKTVRAKKLAQEFFDAQSAGGTRLVKSAWLQENYPDFPAGSVVTFYKQCTVWEGMQASQNGWSQSLLTKATVASAVAEVSSSEPVAIRKTIDVADDERRSILLQAVDLLEEGQKRRDPGTKKVPKGYGREAIEKKMILKYGWSPSASKIESSLKRKRNGLYVPLRKQRLDADAPAVIAEEVLAIGFWYREHSIAFTRWDAMQYFKIMMTKQAPREFLDRWVLEYDADDGMPTTWDEQKVGTVDRPHTIACCQNPLSVFSFFFPSSFSFPQKVYRWYQRYFRTQDGVGFGKRRPLEASRLMWQTPENYRTHYSNLAKLVEEKGIGKINPDFDWDKPPDRGDLMEFMIIPEENRKWIASTDESHAEGETNPKGRNNRSEQTLRCGPDDDGESVSGKGCAHVTYVGTNHMDGSPGRPAVVIAQASFGAAEQAQVPEVTIDGAIVKGKIFLTPSGGVVQDVMIPIFESCVFYQWRDKPDDQWAIALMDGLGEHIWVPFLKWCHDRKIAIQLRTPFQSCKQQGEDVVTFWLWKNVHEFGFYARKQAMMSKVFFQGRSSLNIAEVMECAKGAWAIAFSTKNVLASFAKTGLCPATASPFYDVLASTTPGGKFKQKRLTLDDDTFRALQSVLEPLSEVIKTRVAPSAATEKSSMPHAARRSASINSGDIASIQGGANGADAMLLIEMKTLINAVKSALKPELQETCKLYALDAGGTNDDRKARLCLAVTIGFAPQCDYDILPLKWMNPEDLQAATKKAAQLLLDQRDLWEKSWLPSMVRAANKILAFWAGLQVGKKAAVKAEKKAAGPAAITLPGWDVDPDHSLPPPPPLARPRTTSLHQMLDVNPTEHIKKMLRPTGMGHLNSNYGLGKRMKFNTVKPDL